MATKKATKRPAAQKAPVRSAKVKASGKSGLLPGSQRSFRRAPSEDFFTFRITHQTLYWTILAVIVLALGIWVIYINDRVQSIYDQIDHANSASTNLQYKVSKQ